METLVILLPLTLLATFAWGMWRVLYADVADAERDPSRARDQLQ